MLLEKEAQDEACVFACNAGASFAESQVSRAYCNVDTTPSRKWAIMTF